MLKENIDKASCLLARDYKGFGNQGQTGVRCIEVGHAEEIKGHDILRRVYSANGKSPTLNTMGGGNREPKVAIGAFRGRYLVDGKRQDHKMKTKGKTTQRLRFVEIVNRIHSQLFRRIMSLSRIFVGGH